MYCVFKQKLTHCEISLFMSYLAYLGSFYLSLKPKSNTLV